MGVALIVGVLLIVAFVVGVAAGVGAMWFMERLLHIHTPSPEQIGDIIREQITEDLEAYMDAVDALSELDEEED